MKNERLRSGRNSGEAGASELFFGAGGWEGGVVNKQEAILISHAAVEELISFMQGSHTHTHWHSHTHPYIHMR